MIHDILKRFDLSGKIAAITGGGGELCGAMSDALGAMGVAVAVLDLSLEKAEARAQAVVQAGGTARALRCDVLDPGQMRECYEAVRRLWGPPDFLINGAGGNDPRGSTSDEFHDPQGSPAAGVQSFFDLDPAGFRQVFDLNFMGTFIATQAFSRGMVAQGQGAIVNISSMSAFTPLTKVAAYSAAKAAVATGLSLVLGLPATYSIAKYRQGKIGMIILLARMTPFVSYLLPWYIIFRYLKLIDTYTALTLTHLIITLPMVAWLMVAFFESVPAELEDAAMIDGCSRLKSFLIIVLPLVRNGIATSAIMAFIFSWNQFLFSLILSGPQTKTVPVAVYNFISYGKIDWAGIGAAATLIVLPVSVFAFFVRKTIVQGLTMGALKD